MMKKSWLLLCLAAFLESHAQKPIDVISVTEVSRIENILAADDMLGRRAGTPGADKAADFIAAEFRKAGLQPLDNGSYLQPFSIIRPRLKELKVKVEDVDFDLKNVIVITIKPQLEVDEKSGYTITYIKAGDVFQNKVQQILSADKDMLVMVDPSFQSNFARQASRRQLSSSQKNIIFLLGTMPPSKFKIKAEQEITETKLANVVGMIPGKSKMNELVIFSGHYDHLGIARQPANNDSIYNGANDDAAGITAVIELANYFKKAKNNERTLVFAAFTAEETGGYGSQYFSKQYKPESVIAMFNIEMIGTESKWGKNSAYITGFEKSTMGTILQENLKGTDFTFYPDPYLTERLFYRSDNATLARLGVPAHTISTAKMENEPNYHKLSDEVSTLDLENMAAIIKAVALSSSSIVSGTKTPSRVAIEQ